MIQTILCILLGISISEYYHWRYDRNCKRLTVTGAVPQGQLNPAPQTQLPPHEALWHENVQTHPSIHVVRNPRHSA
jgi:hypothetical protein